MSEPFKGYDDFPANEDKETYGPIVRNWMREDPVILFRIMPDGNLAGIKRQLFTFGIVSHLEMWNFGQRWCYEELVPAILALNIWNGENDPPGPWLKTFYPERHNRLMFRQDEANPAIWRPIPSQELDIAKIWPRDLGETKGQACV